MAAAYPIRPVRRDEFAAFRHADEHAFNGPGPDPGRMELSARLFEPERSLAALDPAAPGYAAGAPARDGDIVGTAGAFTFQMTVPGGVLPVAGVTAVSVLPTHRRRGIARSLMTRQLAEIAQAGTEPLAALWAAEASLYGRYGYGQAASTATFRFARGEGVITTPADPSLRLRLAAPKQALAEMTAVFDAVRPGQPGLFARGDLWWERRTADFEAERGGSGPVRCLIAQDAGGPRGY
ncbi:MAG TPA: GNAT family N-acetyltransferase, partial [Trebonia sp.]|nr:GNAT family N-acetyltransferase [Trebonia sp.]